MNIGDATIFLANTTQGLALGLSVVVLADVVSRRISEWVLAGILIAAWLPFALSGFPDVRRIGSAAVSLYLASLFIAYSRRHGRIEERRVEARKAQETPPVTGTLSCTIRATGGCVPAPRAPMDDQTGSTQW